jgi:UDP-N-acetyl-D-mannosaminuronic acid dehydrogenase
MAKQYKLRVCVLGLGHIGLPSALAIALSGYPVVGVDVDSDRVNLIRNGQLKHSENGFAEKLRSALETRILELADNLDEGDRGSDVYVICVQTPIDRRNKPVLKAAKAAAEAIGHRMKAGVLVAIHSSLPPGTTRTKIAPLLERLSKLHCGSDFWLVASPERMTPSLSLQEFIHSPRAIGGYTPQCADVAASFYANILKGDLLLTDASVAEVSKLAENTFRDVNIAFANELALLCERLRVPVRDVIRIANTHPRVHIHEPGAGVGGPCLPKDPYLLLASGRVMKAASVIMAARRINDDMPDNVVSLIRQSLKNVGKKIKASNVAILGLAYKADVDDTTYSPARRIISLLSREGASIRTFDPIVDESLGGNKCDTLETAVRDADCIVIVTDHTMFRNLDLRQLRTLAQDNPVIVDGRGLFEKKVAEENGFKYATIGEASESW